MEVRHSIREDVAYLKALAKAGRDGVTATWAQTSGVVFSPPLRRSAWVPMAAGATAGLIAAGRSAPNRKRTSTAMVGAAGMGVGLIFLAAWASRSFTRLAARNALQRINASRDARWLQLHPIDYA